MEVLHCRNRDFAFFLQKIVEIINFLFAPQKNDVAVAETHFLTHY